MDNKQKQTVKITLCVLALAVAIQTVSSVITVQIGGATRLTTLNRQRDRYRCYWDCDLVGCQIARDDDECAYDCEKICRLRDDYAAASGRSGAESKASAVEGLAPKSSYPMETLTGKMGALASSSAGQESADVNGQQNEISPEFLGAGTSVRLHLPRNASARNFAIWERCSPDASTGKLTEKPFNL